MEYKIRATQMREGYNPKYPLYIKILLQYINTLKYLTDLTIEEFNQYFGSKWDKDTIGYALYDNIIDNPGWENFMPPVFFSLLPQYKGASETKTWEEEVWINLIKNNKEAGIYTGVPIYYQHTPYEILRNRFFDYKKTSDIIIFPTTEDFHVDDEEEETKSRREPDIMDHIDVLLFLRELKYRCNDINIHNKVIRRFIVKPSNYVLNKRIYRSFCVLEKNVNNLRDIIPALGRNPQAVRVRELITKMYDVREEEDLLKLYVAILEKLDVSKLNSMLINSIHNQLDTILEEEDFLSVIYDRVGGQKNDIVIIRYTLPFILGNLLIYILVTSYKTIKGKRLTYIGSVIRDITNDKKAQMKMTQLNNALKGFYAKTVVKYKDKELVIKAGESIESVLILHADRATGFFYSWARYLDTDTEFLKAVAAGLNVDVDSPTNLDDVIPDDDSSRGLKKLEELVYEGVEDYREVLIQTLVEDEFIDFYRHALLRQDRLVPLTDDIITSILGDKTEEFINRLDEPPDSDFIDYVLQVKLSVYGDARVFLSDFKILRSPEYARVYDIVNKIEDVDFDEIHDLNTSIKTIYDDIPQIVNTYYGYNTYPSIRYPPSEDKLIEMLDTLGQVEKKELLTRSKEIQIELQTMIDNILSIDAVVVTLDNKVPIIPVYDKETIQDICINKKVYILIENPELKDKIMRVIGIVSFEDTDLEWRLIEKSDVMETDKVKYYTSYMTDEELKRFLIGHDTYVENEDWITGLLPEYVESPEGIDFDRAVIFTDLDLTNEGVYKIVNRDIDNMRNDEIPLNWDEYFGVEIEHSVEFKDDLEEPRKIIELRLIKKTVEDEWLRRKYNDKIVTQIEWYKKNDLKTTPHTEKTEKVLKSADISLVWKDELNVELNRLLSTNAYTEQEIIDRMRKHTRGDVDGIHDLRRKIQPTIQSILGDEKGFEFIRKLIADLKIKMPPSLVRVIDVYNVGFWTLAVHDNEVDELAFNRDILIDSLNGKLDDLLNEDYYETDLVSTMISFASSHFNITIKDVMPLDGIHALRRFIQNVKTDDIGYEHVRPQIIDKPLEYLKVYRDDSRLVNENTEKSVLCILQDLMTFGYSSFVNWYNKLSDVDKIAFIRAMDRLLVPDKKRIYDEYIATYPFLSGMAADCYNNYMLSVFTKNKMNVTDLFRGTIDLKKYDDMRQLLLDYMIQFGDYDESTLNSAHSKENVDDIIKIIDTSIYEDRRNFLKGMYNAWKSRETISEYVSTELDDSTLQKYYNLWRKNPTIVVKFEDGEYTFTTMLAIGGRSKSDINIIRDYITNVRNGKYPTDDEQKELAGVKFPTDAELAKLIEDFDTNPATLYRNNAIISDNPVLQIIWSDLNGLSKNIIFWGKYDTLHLFRSSSYDPNNGVFELDDKRQRLRLFELPPPESSSNL